MQNDKDCYTEYSKQKYFDFALLSVIGDRDEQQDSSGYELGEDQALIVICDGMGGHQGGKRASSSAVAGILEEYQKKSPDSDVREVILNAICDADNKISSFKDENGKPILSGTTAVVVYLKERELSWFSVGDSRIYLHRGSELVRATTDHNYALLLNERLAEGSIDRQEYEQEMERGEMLISFLGVNGIERLDTNESPLQLRKDDCILLTTDGLYKLVSEKDINGILSNFSNVNDMAQALQLKAQRQSKKTGKSSDNITFAIIKIK